MNGYTAYSIYTSVRLHFTSKDYDYFLYNGKSRVSEQKFETRKDKYSFVKLSRMYDEKDLPFFLAVNFFRNNKTWISDLLRDEAKEIYTSWKRDQESRKYLFKEMLRELEEHDFAKLIICEEGNPPDLLMLVFHNDIVSVENFLLLDYYLKLIDAWNDNLEYDFFWQDYRKRLLKYSPFFFCYEHLDHEFYKKELKKYLTKQRR